MFPRPSLIFPIFSAHLPTNRKSQGDTFLTLITISTSDVLGQQLASLALLFLATFL